jgi:hypothetical protein
VTFRRAFVSRNRQSIGWNSAYRTLVFTEDCESTAVTTFNWCLCMERIFIKPSWTKKGRAIAQAVSRWLPTAAARVRARVWSCGICGGQSGAGAGFFRVPRFPLPIFIPPIARQSPSSIIWGLYNRPEVAAIPSWLSPTPLRKKKPLERRNEMYAARSSGMYWTYNGLYGVTSSQWFSSSFTIVMWYIFHSKLQSLQRQFSFGNSCDRLRLTHFVVEAIARLITDI